MICAKVAEAVEMLFGVWTHMGPRKHLLDGVYIGATWRIRLNHPCEVAMQPFCQITLTTCYLVDMFVFDLVAVILMSRLVDCGLNRFCFSDLDFVIRSLT